MAIPSSLTNLKLPVIAAPMFLASGVDLVVSVCRTGMIGTFPSLNQRSSQGYSGWLSEIASKLAETPGAAPFGVNLVLRKSNDRLEEDIRITVEHRVPLVITSLGASKAVVDAVHGYGGLVFHDVVNVRHARKAAEAGVDGIIAVCAGAGGHAGSLSPFALVNEIASFFSGTIVLSGAISTGRHIAAARAIGADLAYVGTRFIATKESMAEDAYKQMLVSSHAADIIYTPNVSGVNANFLRPSIAASGLDPDSLPPHEEIRALAGTSPWKTLWSAGQGVGAVHDIPSVTELAARMSSEYRDAIASLSREHFGKVA